VDVQSAEKHVVCKTEIIDNQYIYRDVYLNVNNIKIKKYK